ncbi:MAG: glycosyltransferase family 2 protein [Candidatus Acidiferrum sp.]
MPVDVAFVTVNYNTLACVRQLAAFFNSLDTPFTFSVTVVDNQSSDGSQEFLQSSPDINYIQTGGNIGYGRAINRGVAATDSKYVCATNTDVILNRDALIALWRFMEGRPDAGVCAPRITYEDGRDQGMLFRRSLFSQYTQWYAKALSAFAKHNLAKATEPVRVEGVMGAFFLIRRSVMPQPALFDEDFFFFHEDIALAHTLLNRGVPCFVVPSAKIIHIGGQSRSPASVSAFYESKYLYLEKFHGPFHARAVYLFDRARILRKWLFYWIYSLLSPSERIKSKQHYYKIAWNTMRWK